MRKFQAAFTESDFRQRSTFGLSLAGCLASAPFALYNLARGQYIIGFVGLTFAAVAGANAVFLYRGRHSPDLTYYVLTPIAILTLLMITHVQALIGVFWCFPGILGIYTILPEKRAWIANGVLLAGLVPLILNNFELALAARVIVTLLVVSIFSIISTREITKQRNLLTEQAMLDPLTRLLNRTSQSSTVERARQQSLRSALPMTLLSMDIDHFKKINDNHGHDKGDDILKSVADLLQRHTRDADYVFRMGGEEFLVLLHGASLSGGVVVAEKLRRQLQVVTQLHGVTVTASFGVAEFEPDETSDSWLVRADRRMYLAKESGRDRVCGDARAA